MAIRRTLDEQIDAAKQKIEQKENYLKGLLGKQKEKERKARNHRLCQRGGVIEKALPDIIMLTDEQFGVFVQKALLSGYAARVIKELLPPAAPMVTDAPPSGGTTADKPFGGNPQATAATAPKPPVAPNTHGGSANNKTPGTARETA
jgi:hypothetical protein